MRDDGRDDVRVWLRADGNECPCVLAFLRPWRGAEKTQNFPMRDQLENARVIVLAQGTQDETRGLDDVLLIDDGHACRLDGAMDSTPRRCRA
jgi:hypothetical protein